MKREDYITYCGDCIPDKYVVVYTTVEKCSVDKTPSGYKMGIRYRRNPPKKYGTTAVTPNIAARWVGCRIDDQRKQKWFTSRSNRMFGSREKAEAFARGLDDEWPKKGKKS